MTRLPEQEYLVLSVLNAGEAIEFTELVDRVKDPKKYGIDLFCGLQPQGYPQTGWNKDQSFLMAGVKSLSDRGLVSVVEETKEELSLVEHGGLSAIDRGLPERQALEAIHKAGGAVSLAELPKRLGWSD